MNPQGNFQPKREEVRGLPPSRTVIRVVELSDAQLCHLLSCYHLAEIDPETENANDIQKRRCLACLELEQARPKVRTLVAVKRA